MSQVLLWKNSEDYILLNQDVSYFCFLSSVSKEEVIENKSSPPQKINAKMQELEDSNYS